MNLRNQVQPSTVHDPADSHYATSAQLLAAYRQPQLAASLWQLVVTLLLWTAMWPLMWWSLGVGYWLTLLLAVPAAFLSIRLFILQHDCGHGSFFKSRTANEYVGCVLSALTLTPYHCWRREHAIHHAGNGNLDHRGIGDVTTKTVDEYLAMSKWDRLKYRLYRNPLVLFGAGPIFHFAIFQRLTFALPKSWRRERMSIHLTNLALLTIGTGLCLTVGWRAIVLIYLPVMTLAASIGVWLFYVQHQFHPTYWQTGETWNYHAAAMEGSSYYHLPWLLRWATANIGFHHIHHLDSRVPNYRLPGIFQAHAEFQQPHRLSIGSSLRCAVYKLWDEKQRKLVRFRDLSQPVSSTQASPRCDLTARRSMTDINA